VELARFAYESSLNRMWPRLLPIIAQETRPAVPLDYLETAAACEASTTIPNKYFARIARFDRDVFNDPVGRARGSTLLWEGLCNERNSALVFLD